MESPGTEDIREMSSEESRTNQDRVYRKPLKSIPPFSFNEEVAVAFDDMAERSIPFYEEIQRLTVALAQRYARRGTNIYDLGCSTGTTILKLREALSESGPANVSIRGIDSSGAMCRRAKVKLGLGCHRDRPGSTLRNATGHGEWHDERSDAAIQSGGKANARQRNSPSPATRSDFYASDLHDPEVVIKQGDVNHESIENSSVVIMNYTLQFVRPEERRELVGRVLDGLNPGGVLLVSDKMLQSSTNVSRVFLNIYHDMKRNQGYSELEIAQKREALENVLIPYRVEEEQELLLRKGFSSVDVFFSWCNFTSFLCVKDELS